MRKKFSGRRSGTRGRKPPDRELADRARRVRKELGRTQEGFAKLLGVKQSAVSAWEQGRPAPTGINYARLGNAALSYEDILWFWHRAGLDVKVFERAADDRLKGFSISGDLVEIRSLQEAEAEKLGLPESMVANRRLSTRYLRVPNEIYPGEFLPFRPGDTLLIDTSETDLRGFDELSLVALDVTQGKAPIGNLPSGLLIGWLEKQDATIGSIPTFHFHLRTASSKTFFMGSSTGSRALEPIREHQVLGRVTGWIADPKRQGGKK